MGVKDPKSNNNKKSKKAVGLHMTMPQAAGKTFRGKYFYSGSILFLTWLYQLGSLGNYVKILCLRHITQIKEYYNFKVVTGKWYYVIVARQDRDKERKVLSIQLMKC